ncbi:hypothetical protein SeMB42_g02372 [Synchytrium endobioticum]|uniref:Uncharacterized protein n=1 Tax=Synchytrium endobioticum TaxID=286115 RepID=A0A507D7L3_9FUNG|nr:hypothetical protein SeLEV6574_g02687 [Synchytrium endobioticum]TPX50081.1 hypothetical protein SeMB42_g02372 [Synchytrium endobioticum]
MVSAMLRILVLASALVVFHAQADSTYYSARCDHDGEMVQLTRYCCLGKGEGMRYGERCEMCMIPATEPIIKRYSSCCTNHTATANVVRKPVTSATLAANEKDCSWSPPS